MAKQPSITTLSQIVGNETSALNTINTNFSNIQSQFDLFLSLNGDTPNSMTADLDMNSNRILNTGDPTGNQDAATKKYVDDAVSNAALGSSAGIANSQLFVDGVDFTAGSSTQITLSEDPGTDANLSIVMDGTVMIEGIEWTRSGTTVTFLAVIPADVTNIQAKWNNTINNFTVADDSVTAAKIVTGAVGSDELNAEALTGQSSAVVAAGDTFIFTDADDSNALKKDTVQGILDLVPSFTSTDITGQTDTAVAVGDSFVYADTDDSDNLKKDTIQGIIDLVPVATTSAKGIGEIATQAEADAGTDTTRWITPETLAGRGFGLVKLAESSMSGTTTNFENLISSTYQNYMFVVQDVDAGADGTFGVRLRNTGGSYYTAGYPWAAQEVSATGPTSTAKGSSSDDRIVICDSFGGSAGDTLNVVIMLYNPLGSENTYLTYQTGFEAAGVYHVWNGMGTKATAIDIDALQLISTQSVTGTVSMYGLT